MPFSDKLRIKEEVKEDIVMAEEKKVLSEKESEQVTGGEWRPDSKMARVYSLDGSGVKIYNTSISGNEPTNTVPDGTTMKVDPNLEPEQPWILGRVFEACYWACYNNKWVAIKANEVRIEWIGE